jgi:superfamily II DNA or RNA helicase
MAGNRLLAPVTSALGILEEYHKDVEKRLWSYRLGDDVRGKIITDVYAKDDIFFSLNRPYEHIEIPFWDYCRDQKLHVLLPDILPFLAKEKSLYTHQADAIKSILAEKTTIISTGTGSGKTESFLIPILHHCLGQKSKDIPGIKAVILYPLNALANDQIRRIIEAVKNRGIRVGCFVGSTPGFKIRKPGDPVEKCISRQEMIDRPPDILITNYVMLDRLITNPKTRPMFVSSEQTLKYIVVDEVHYFRGTKGANLSLLLRRLRTLCKQPLVQIGASGTLRRGGGYYPDSKQDSIEQFARLIFGNEAVPKNGFQLIEPVFPVEQIRSSEPLAVTDDIEGDSFLSELDNVAAKKLCEQLSAKALINEKRYSKDNIFKNDPMYRFAMSNPFIASMRERLTRTPERPASGACTFQETVELFRQLYWDTYSQEPRNPKRVVEAYWSLINYLNHRCEEQRPSLPLILDYRLHLILGNFGDSLTRCLLCKRYHDGRCLRCRHCGNGLLFKVSKGRPDCCIAYLAGKEIFPKVPLKRPKFDVLVQLIPEQLESTDTSVLLFSLEPILDTSTDEESYLLRPTHQGEGGITICLSRGGQDMEALPLNEPRLYWYNVLKVTDALVVRPETRTSDKLLGFIDNRERASGIKLRLNDDIAERTLTAWAASKWSQMGEMKLEDAFKRLQGEIPSATVTLPDEKEDAVNTSLHEALREMPFWFSRMLADLKSYQEEWEVYVDRSLVLHPDEDKLLNEIMLSKAAIDRTSFWTGESVSLKHFHVDKYRVETRYGVGMKSASDRDYNIISLGEQGRLYESFIEQITSVGIQDMLDSLTARGILVREKISDDISFYQLHTKYLMIETSRGLQPGEGISEKWEEKFATVECHTADHSDELRSQIEARFSEGKVQALICTPTLEMGVDIGKLSSVLMIGFPPSPANYAQRAGRAGRSDKSHLATIVVLSSPEDAHDEYYYSTPQKMIDGAITPPQFTLTNFALLAAHVYAYLSGAKGLPILSNTLKLEESLMEYIEQDELHLRDELGENYTTFKKYLIKDCRRLPSLLKSNGSISIEACYRLGIFPDYGFRRDGLPLIKGGSILDGKEDEEDFLTSREPEQAARKLVPGRIVFCGGKAVKVDENQPQETYEIQKDPTEKEFRYYKYVVADEKKDVQIEKRRDPDRLYRLSRFLDVKKPFEELEMQGPAYCRVYFVRQGTLFFINEGEVQQNGLQSLKDFEGDYRFGTSIERDGLLVCFADHILPPDLKSNFLAVLLRGIPDYFDLDDSELRVVQNLLLYPQSEHEPVKRVSFFIYGHDESGLVPFEKIFNNLEKMINSALYTLKTCSCEREGCYLCLFSLNSRALTGRISHRGAIDCLSVYLHLPGSLLKPHIAPAKDVITQVDTILTLSRSGDQYRVVAENTLTRKREEYTGGNTEEDQNTRIYTVLRVALEQVMLKQEWESGNHTVKICCRENYIYEQLRGENDVKNGREAFLNLWLTLLKWQNWKIEKM